MVCMVRLIFWEFIIYLFICLKIIRKWMSVNMLAQGLKSQYYFKCINFMIHVIYYNFLKVYLVSCYFKF
jgi:hypothetical protein